MLRLSLIAALVFPVISLADPGQGLVFRHTYYLMSIEDYRRGMDALYDYQAFVKESRKAYGDDETYPKVASVENIAQKIVVMAQLNHAKLNTDESKQSLIRAYGNYVDNSPVTSTACVYLTRKMKLEGQVDLDVLVEMYKNCEDDGGQYHGNLLGLSNRLVDAHRPDDALFFLSQLDEKKIPADRLAEKYYAMARAYEQNKDMKNALKYYFLVNDLTNRFAGAKLKIEEITGIVAGDQAKP